MPTDVLKNSLPLNSNHKIPGDLDIIGGSLSNGILSKPIIGIEVKRFRYVYSDEKQSWVVKNPDSYGREQARGYSFFGFDKIMLCHFIVAEPVHHPDCNPHLLNASIIANGIDAVVRKKIELEAGDPFGYCIVGWSQVPHKDSLHAGSLPGPVIIKSAPKNPLAIDKGCQSIQSALLQMVQERIMKYTQRPLPIIINFSQREIMR